MVFGQGVLTIQSMTTMWLCELLTVYGSDFSSFHGPPKET